MSRQGTKIYELASDLKTIIKVWESMTAAALEKGVAKQSIYDADATGQSCAGSYWMREDRWKMREGARSENRKNV